MLPARAQLRPPHCVQPGALAPLSSPALPSRHQVRELAILGFVSFTATVIMQFVPLSEEATESFEYSHVLLFVTAIFYAVEISVISVVVPTIEAEFVGRDKGPRGALRRASAAAMGEEKHLGEEEYLEHLIKEEQSVWARFDQRLHGVLDNVFGAFLFARLHPAGLRHVQETKRTSAFKVLNFHFMARNELLGASSGRFSWSTYAKKTMENRVDEMVEVTWRSWLLVIGVLACGMVGIRLTRISSVTHVLLFFLLAGWALCLAMVRVRVRGRVRGRGS